MTDSLIMGFVRVELGFLRINPMYFDCDRAARWEGTALRRAASQAVSRWTWQTWKQLMGATPPLLLGLLLASPATLVAAPPKPVAVIAAEVRLAPFVDRVEALGTLRANESVELTANVTETVTAIHFDDGQRVEQGDLLVELTSAEQHALLKEAQVRIDEAERQYRRVSALVEQRSASESLLDERRRDLDTARAALLGIESRLADRLIKAPFAGVLGLRNISPGALVRPGDRITSLDDDSLMKLDFAVPSLFLTSLTPGLRIEARSRDYGERVFAGAVRSVDSRIDPVTRSIQVRALIPNPDRTLKPGLLMQVDLLRNPRESLVVPEAALLHQGTSHYVIVATPEGIAERRPVEVGARRKGEVEIVSGLTVGELVVTHGNDKVRPGQALTVRVEREGAEGLQALSETAR
jgi:membrane fusion protein (multidrug efflux system)